MATISSSSLSRASVTSILSAYGNNTPDTYLLLIVNQHLKVTTSKEARKVFFPTIYRGCLSGVTAPYHFLGCVRGRKPLSDRKQEKCVNLSRVPSRPQYPLSQEPEQDNRPTVSNRSHPIRFGCPQTRYRLRDRSQRTCIRSDGMPALIYQKLLIPGALPK